MIHKERNILKTKEDTVPVFVCTDVKGIGDTEPFLK